MFYKLHSIHFFEKTKDNRVIDNFMFQRTCKPLLHVEEFYLLKKINVPLLMFCLNNKYESGLILILFVIGRYAATWRRLPPRVHQKTYRLNAVRMAPHATMGGGSRRCRSSILSFSDISPLIIQNGRFVCYRSAENLLIYVATA